MRIHTHILINYDESRNNGIINLVLSVFLPENVTSYISNAVGIVTVIVHDLIDLRV